MKHNGKRAKSRERKVSLWTYERAQAALPYLASVVRSLREHYLESAAQRRRAALLAGRPGRPNRETLIALEEHNRAAAAADGRFQDTLAELESLDIFCLDPNRGQALVPFLHGEELAWYVFDLFEQEPFRFWRYHTDPLDARRPTAELLGPQSRSA